MSRRLSQIRKRLKFAMVLGYFIGVVAVMLITALFINFELSYTGMTFKEYLRYNLMYPRRW